MKTTNKLAALVALCMFVAVSFVACDKDDNDDTTPDNVHEFFADDVDVATAIQETMITMDDGDIIHLHEGTYNFTATLSLNTKNNITIRGEGRENTILNFDGQTAGAEGLKADFTDMLLLMDFTIENTVGDAIKIKDSEGVTFMNIGAVWTGEADESNGAYGLYPVSCKHVLLDGCYARGASDAGVYVGQSEHVIVRNCTAINNVAGIEIENCNFADVYGNTATENTGGILIFDLPGLSIKNGQQCRIYDNTIVNNSYRNFAPEGNIVGNVPSGTGIMIMTSKEVEVFNNTITNNNVMGVGIISYDVLEFFDSNLSYDDDEYIPFINNIHVHDNTFSRTTDYPDEQNTIGNLLVGQYLDGDMPDILFDGLYDPSLADDMSRGICIHSNGDARFVNLDVENFFENKDEDASPHDCTQEALPAVVINAPLP